MFFLSSRSVTATSPGHPDLSLLPGMETTPNGRFRHHALDIVSGEPLRFKGCARSYYADFIAKMFECTSSEYVLPSIRYAPLSTLPCRSLLCRHQACFPPSACLRQSYISMILYYVPVSVTSFTSAVLLKRTRLQTTNCYWHYNWNP